MPDTPRTGSVRYLLNGTFHRLAYFAWGDPDAQPLVCVHGLTRNAHDFDVLAAALADQFHVICPDLPGRGGSDWLADGAVYQPATYVQALSYLLATINRPVHWLGTSLGGICGMALGACCNAPIDRLILNDIGPFIPAAALGRIKAYMSQDHIFPNLRALELHLRTVHAPFGNLTDAAWETMAKHSCRVVADGTFAMHYDPAIAVPIRASEPQDADMSAWWHALGNKVLVIRGEASDLLLPQTLATMEADGAESLVVRQAGHAPALLDKPTIERVRGFLDK